VEITVLNGSPKGDLSVTLQYVLFIQKRFPQHRLKVFNIAQDLRKIEKDEGAFREVIDAVGSSDGVLWAFPLYYCLVHSNYKRFIEIIWERGAQSAFKDKYTASLSTSIHFYDHTAHNYINAVCDDLGMKYTGPFSAEMNDLLKEAGQQKLISFAGHFFEAIETHGATPRNHAPLVRAEFEYSPGVATDRIDSGGRKVLVLTDCGEGQTNLSGMIRRFQDSFAQDIDVVNLRDVNVKSGCLGCLHCGYDNKCVFQDKDQYVQFFNTRVKIADVLVFAGAIRDRYLSSRWKLFFDRSFFNGHAPVLMGKQFAFIISGPLGQIPNLRQILEAYTELEYANLAGFVTDEPGDSTEVDALLDGLARRSIAYCREGYIRPPTLLGVGGSRLFRDEIWGRLRPTFQADHRFYRRHAMYDFPQKDCRMRLLVALFMLLSKLPAFRKEYARRTIPEMVKPLQKVVAKAREAPHGSAGEDATKGVGGNYRAIS